MTLASCAPSGQRIRGAFSVGTFTGSAGPELARALQRHATIRPERGPFLSGTAEYRFESSAASETVLTTEEGDERVYWEDDPLTGESWLVKAWVRNPVPKDYGFRRARGVLTVDWQVASASVGTLRSGRDVFSLVRAAGGYADRDGRPPADPDAPTPDDRELHDAVLDELAARAAVHLTLLAGQRLTENDLAYIPDQDGRRARALAAAGHWDAAALIWEELLGRNPNYGPALYNLGLHGELDGDLPRAWRYFRLAFRSQQLPEYREALSRVSEVLRRMGRLPRPDGSLM
jgi:tetratricopeptide (TPR) repeat protein